MNIPIVTCKEIFKAHYGKALKASDRELSGTYKVYGSSGSIGQHDAFLIDEPTVVIGRKGSVGEIVYVPEGGWVIDTAFYIELIDKTKCDLRYLFYALKNANLNSLTISTSIPGLNRDDLYKTKIPLPSLEEQKRIAAILDMADAICRKRQQAIDLTDQLLCSVFLELFGDPVTNPKGWDLVSFGSVGQLDRGKSKHRPRNDPVLLGGNHPLIQTGDVANSGGYITKYKSTYSDVGLRQSKKWPAGTLCITIAANIANTGILEFDACFPDSIVGFTPHEMVTVEYVQAWLGFLQKIIEDAAPESAQKNINLEILRDLVIPLPDIEQQKKFSHIVHHVKSTKDRMSSGVDEIQTLFTSLTHQAFGGELSQVA